MRHGANHAGFAETRCGLRALPRHVEQQGAAPHPTALLQPHGQHRIVPHAPSCFRTRWCDALVAIDQRVTEALPWATSRVFLKNVLPVAKSGGVRIGWHLHDLPLSPLRGVGRIFTSAAAFERAMALSDSPSHGITFCQADFRLVNEDLLPSASRFAKRAVIVYLRDIAGTVEEFPQPFHDNGPTDKVATLKQYQYIGFRGLIRVDHVPLLAGGHGRICRMAAPCSDVVLPPAHERYPRCPPYFLPLKIATHPKHFSFVIVERLLLSR